MKEQGESREILFAASLGDGLTGAVSKAVAKTSLAGTLRPGVGWRGLLYTYWRGQMHMVLV
jgi:hypothetical protein